MQRFTSFVLCLTHAQYRHSYKCDLYERQAYVRTFNSVFLFHPPPPPPPLYPHTTATQLLAPLGCHNPPHITWGDPRTEWTKCPLRGKKMLRQPNRIATSWSGLMGTTCKQRQPLALIGADKWRSDRGRSDGLGWPIAIETELCFYRPNGRVVCFK